MAKQEANIGLNYGWNLGDSGWNLQMDENLKALGALVNVSVLSATTQAPPAAPEKGHRYLIPAAGVTGDWAGHEKKIARWNGSAWELFPARSGWEITAQDSLQRWHFDGTDWALVFSRMKQAADDAGAASSGVPVHGAYIRIDTGALTIRRS